MTDYKEQFKSYLRKIGSGEKTSNGLTRLESADAMKLILESKATPAQIGAFMIAHRIRRPEPQELAGMIDTYLELGPKLKSKEGQTAPLCFGIPFDGRSKTAPIYPLTALILLTKQQPVVLQGGQRMPVKYGITTTELFSMLGLELKGLTKKNLQKYFDATGLAVIHQPDHFPKADRLISYRDEIGKRPPIASMELIWTAHEGKHLLVSGFVHPPTEERAWKALQILAEQNFITIKGLEGSTDLPISRPCITARNHTEKPIRYILHPKKYNLSGKDIPWENLTIWHKQAINALNNKGLLADSLIWNAAVYLWYAGIANNIDEGIIEAKEVLNSGKALQTLENLISFRSMYG